MDRIKATLKSARERRGLTQAELGERAGMAAAAISHFENGVRAPSLESLIRLADALDITTDELLGRVAYATSRVDPLFLRAAQSDARTYDVLKRVTEALLDAQASANAQPRSPEPPPAPGAP